MSVPILGIPEQAWKIQEDCERAAIRDALVSSYWYRLNLWLGLTSTVTAAIAGFLAGTGSEILSSTGSINSKTVIAFFALLSAVLASTLTFLAPSEKANAFQQTSNKYHSLRERLRFFINSGSEDAGKTLKAQLEAFIVEKKEIDVDHPILPEWAYRRAQKKIMEKIKRNGELKRARESAQS
jgi:hypothetical protein